jgi:hypothetical protein
MPEKLLSLFLRKDQTISLRMQSEQHSEREECENIFGKYSLEDYVTEYISSTALIKRENPIFYIINKTDDSYNY